MAKISKSSTLTKAGNIAKVHGVEHSDLEAKTVETAESFSPTTSADWDSVPATQDAGLNELASRTKDLEVVTTQGDLIVGDSGGDPDRLAVGAANTVLKSDGTDPAWGSIVNANVDAAAAIDTSKLAGSAHDEGADNLVRVAIGYMTAAELVAAGDGVAAVCFGSTDIPDNAIILDGMVDVLTTFAGDGDDGSTIEIGVNSTTDIVAAIAISDGSNPWDSGLQAIVPLGTAATAVKLTAARDISVEWNSGGTDTTLSAGEMRIILRYVVSG